MSSTPASHFALGCLLGGVIFFLLYGFAPLDVTNVNWLTHSVDNEGLWDLTQHYLGWVYFRNSPWHFPFGLLDHLYSSPISIVYTDSIPLFAIIFKALSPILPETFQYFGLFGLICYMFMGGFGALIVRKFSSSCFISAIAAILFCISPVLTKRMFYHTALSAHFLILMAFCLWLYHDTFSNKKYCFFWCLLLSGSTLINPYYAPMVLGIYLCFCLQKLLEAKKKKKVLFYIAGFTFIICAVMNLVSYFVGFFYGHISASTGGLERLSFNLTQLFNPMNYLCDVTDYQYTFTPQSYSTFLPNLPLASGWQEEGFSYLGLGVILLLVLCLINCIYRKLTSNTPGIFNLSQKIAIWVCGVVFTFLALSPTITFGSKTLCQISYPKYIYYMLSIFRSCGRFIWPVYYGLLSLLLISCAHLYNKFKSKKILVVLLFCTLLQMVDLWPSFTYKYEAYHKELTEYSLELKDSAWKILGENATQIMFYPPTEFGIECDPHTSCVFETYALDYDLSLNISYLSRDMSSVADRKTLSHFKTRKEGASYPEIIYIFFDFSDIPDSAQSHLNYYVIDGYIVGTELTLQNCEVYTP